MPKRQTPEIVTEALSEHPAVKAWCELRGLHVEPCHIEVLKLKHKIAAYRLVGVGPRGGSIITKRFRTAKARVERMIYEEILPQVPLPALRCHGFLEEPGGEFCWLFLEEANGEFYSPQRDEHRKLAGRWLGSLHLTTLSADSRARLPERRPDHYLQRLRAVRAKFNEYLDNRLLPGADLKLLRTVAGHCDALEARWEEVEECCAAMPRTLVHGDFVVKNLRVRDGPTGPELLIFDWELAGWGVPAADLAQFVGSTASPDLDVYCSVLGQFDLRDLQRMAGCGGLLRIVDELYWPTTFITDSAYKFFIRPIGHFRL